MNHGMPISTAAKTSSGSQLLRRPRSSPRASTIGSRIAALMAQRLNTNTTGGSSFTAIRMNR